MVYQWQKFHVIADLQAVLSAAQFGQVYSFWLLVLVYFDETNLHKFLKSMALSYRLLNSKRGVYYFCIQNAASEYNDVFIFYLYSQKNELWHFW